MSSSGPKKSAWTRLLHAFALAAIFGLFFGATRVVPRVDSPAAIVAAIGFLLLAGTLLSEVLEIFGLPHLTGYLAAGAIAGPFVCALVDEHTVERLQGINALALALIALEGGAQLRLATMRAGLRSLSWHMVMQTLPVAVVSVGAFLLARPLMPFLKPFPPSVGVGVALLWGVMAMTRSPAAVLGVAAQTRANGPVARFSITFVMTSNLVVVVLMAIGMMAARPLIDPMAAFSLSDLRALGRELLGSVALGTTLGLALVLYLRLVNKQLILVYLALGFGMTEVLSYVRYQPLLTFMVAGFVVQNLSKQGDKLLASIADTGSVVYVVFFATAGAHLDIDLLRRLWPVAILFVAVRWASTVAAGRAASRIARDEPVVRTWSWAALVAQAGLALGVANVIASQFPGVGKGFRALAVACATLNEVVGPVLFKIALDRTGEVQTEARRSLSSLSGITPTSPKPS
ncbi:MAG TPA: sodium:proton exchanger [Minicystis sp.]|nr:sodium:proton exchanger [Minicystis sp.]